MLAKSELRSLTGLRGIAAILVMFYHYDNVFVSCGRPLAGPLWRLIGHGYLMVDLFLVLSGFIMALNYADMFAAVPIRAAFTVFLLRRVARIYPLFLFVTAILIVLRLLGLADPLGLHDALPGPMLRPVILNLLMVQAWGLDRSIDFASWSLSSEWAAYLLFPLLCMGALFGRAWLALVSAAWAAACLAGIAATPNSVMGMPCRFGPLDDSSYATALPVLRCVADFVIGLVTYRLSGLRLVQDVAASTMAGWVVCLALAVLLALPGTDLLLVVGFSPLILVLAHGRNGAASLLASPLPHLSGELSYAIYLLHPLMHGLVMWMLWLLHDHGALHAFGLTDLVAGGLVVALAYPVHVLVEKPGRRLMRGLEEMLRPTLAA